MSDQVKTFGPFRLPAARNVWIIAGVLLNAVVAIGVRFFPYGDTENHLARYTLIALAWRHSAPPWIHFHWIPTAYIAVDSAGAALASFLSPEVTLKVIVAAYVILLPTALFALFQAVERESNGWAAIACILTFNWYFLTGFLSYVIGIAAALLWLAWWWPRRFHPSVLQLACGGLGVGVLYMIHMASVTTIAVVLAAWSVEPMITRARFSSEWVGTGMHRGFQAAAFLLPALLIHFLLSAANVLPHPASDALIFRDAADKFRHFLTPFASFSRIEAGYLAGAYAVALTVFLAHRSGSRPNVVWITAVAGLLLAYLLFPLVALGAWDVDVRFLLPAYLLAFLAFPANTRQGGRQFRPAPWLFLATAVHAAIVASYSHSINTRLTDLLALGKSAPDDAHILALSSSDDAYFRVDPFTHAAERLVADDPNIRVNGLFSGGPNGAYLGHFVVSSAPYDPGIHWARKGFPDLNWKAVRRDYTMILLEGSEPAAQRRILEGATPIAKRGDAELFSVNRE